jgi:microcystin-dependent protein
MSYPIRKTDGSLVIDLAVGTTDFTRTSLALIGKNASDFGLNQNQNFVRILENSANTDEPHNSITGQLWFNTAAQQINVKTSSGFKPIGPFAAPTTPAITDTSNTLATTAFVHSILPTGSIILWYGSVSAIPVGWALCNGQSVYGIQTPDLCGVFVMGAGTSPAKLSIPGYVPKNPGDAGGKSSITTTPAHQHTFTTNDHSIAHTHQFFATGNVAPHKHVFPGDDQLSFANGKAQWNANSRAGFNYDATSKGSGGGQLWETSTNLDGAGTSVSVQGTTAGIFETDALNHSHGGTTNSVGDGSVDVTNPYYALAYIMKVI